VRVTGHYRLGAAVGRLRFAVCPRPPTGARARTAGAGSCRSPSVATWLRVGAGSARTGLRRPIITHAPVAATRWFAHPTDEHALGGDTAISLIKSCTTCIKTCTDACRHTSSSGVGPLQDGEFVLSSFSSKAEGVRVICNNQARVPIEIRFRHAWGRHDKCLPFAMPLKVRTKRQPTLRETQMPCAGSSTYKSLRSVMTRAEETKYAGKSCEVHAIARCSENQQKKKEMPSGGLFIVSLVACCRFL
jgi:hypothetical protein